VPARSRALAAVALASPLLLVLMAAALPAHAFPAAMGVHAVSVLVAAAAMLRSASTGDPQLRRARRWFAAALGMAALGFVTAGIHTLLAGEVPVVSPANLTVIGWVGCALAGLFSVPSSPYGEGGRVRALVDGVVVTAATSLAFWVLFLEPVWQTTVDSAQARAVLIAYPVADLVVAVSALAVMAHVRADQRRFLQVAVLGLLCIVVSDAGSAAAIGTDEVRGFTWTNVALQAGLGVLVVAALLPARPQLEHGRLAAAVDAFLPQAPVLVAVPVALHHAVVHEQDRVAPVISAVMVLALVARQLLYAAHLTRVAHRLQVDATRDALTGLVNRRTCLAAIGDALAEREPGDVAVVLLDLDGFKEVNDGFGHAAGDVALRHVAQVLARRSDAAVAARLGGDEFALVVVGEGAETEAVAAARALTVEQWVDVGALTVQMGASAGVAVSRPGDTTSALLRRADLAMYEAKRSGARVEVFIDAIADRAERRHLLTAALRGAAARGETELVYQPLVRLADGATLGAEALLRWRSPLHGVVLPGEFVPLAEDTGVVAELGLWVLERAAADLRSWDDAGRWLPELFVNVSPHQLVDGFPEAAVAAVRAHGIDPGRVTLEITESAVPDAPSSQCLQQLRAAGFRIAMDDFGAGFSSLAQLAVLPVDTLKFDRAFLLGTGTDSGRRIVEAFLALAGQLGLTTVAEGVETAEEAGVVRRAGCELAQGWFFARPVPAADLQGALPAVVPAPRPPGVAPLVGPAAGG
jgi:diguanylate cyclase